MKIGFIWGYYFFLREGKIQLKTWFSISESIFRRKHLKLVLTFLISASSLHEEVIWIYALNLIHVAKEKMGIRRGWHWLWQKLWHSHVLLSALYSCQEEPHFLSPLPCLIKLMLAFQHSQNYDFSAIQQKLFCPTLMCCISTLPW